MTRFGSRVVTRSRGESWFWVCQSSGLMLCYLAPPDSGLLPLDKPEAWGGCYWGLWIKLLLVLAAMEDGNFSANTRIVSMRHCVPWTKWYWASAAVVAPFKSFGNCGFGGYRELKRILNVLPSIPPINGVYFPFPWIYVGPMTSLDQWNVVEKMLCNFKGWALGGLQCLTSLFRTLFLEIQSPRCEKAQAFTWRGGLRPPADSTICQPQARSFWTGPFQHGWHHMKQKNHFIYVWNHWK